MFSHFLPSVFVRWYFVFPEFWICFWHDITSLATVPKTTVKKNRNLSSFIGDIRSAEHRIIVNSISYALAPQDFSNHNFWFGILWSNAGHNTASYFFGKFVWHTLILTYFDKSFRDWFVVCEFVFKNSKSWNIFRISEFTLQLVGCPPSKQFLGEIFP